MEQMMNFYNKNCNELGLILSEENTIFFAIQISGHSWFQPRPETKINFIITELISGNRWVIPATRTKEGATVNINIPAMEVSNAEKYSGKLEVIVGGQTFYPNIVNVKFFTREQYSLLQSIITLKGLNLTDVLMEI